MIKELQNKYMNRYLSKSVIQVKDTYTPLYEKYSGLNLDYEWFMCWYEQVALRHAEDFDMRRELVNLFNLYSASGKSLEAFCEPVLLERFDELTVAYFQAYMWYKVAGIRYEMECIKKFQVVQPEVVECSKYVDHNFKIDCTYNKIAIQIKNYNFSYKMAEEFYHKARRWGKCNRFVYYGTNGAFEKIDGVWRSVDIWEVLDYENKEI